MRKLQKRTSVGDSFAICKVTRIKKSTSIRILRCVGRHEHESLHNQTNKQSKSVYLQPGLSKGEHTHSIQARVIISVVVFHLSNDHTRLDSQSLDFLRNLERLDVIRQVDVVSERSEVDVLQMLRIGCVEISFDHGGPLSVVLCDFVAVVLAFRKPINCKRR